MDEGLRFLYDLKLVLAFSRKEIIVLTQIVRVMRAIKFLLFAVLLIQASFVDAQNNNVSRRRGRGIASSVKRVRELFASSFDVKNPSLRHDSAKVQITSYTRSLPNDIKKELTTVFNKKFIAACNDEASELALETGWLSLLIDEENNSNMIYEVLITLYGEKGEKDNLEYTLNLFESFSNIHNNDYANTLDELKEKYQDVLHPKTFEEVITGRWISLDNFPVLDKYELPFDNFPHFIIDIENIGRNNGATLAYAPTLNYNVASKSKIWQRNYDMKQLRFSQKMYVNGKENNALLRFASEKVNYAKTEMAIAGHASNRQFEAEAKAKIWSSKHGSFGEKLGADVATSVYVGLADAIYDALTIGSKKVEAYAIDFSNPSPITMDAIIGYEKVKETTTGNHTTMNDITNVNHFVKWEESDSVIFISQNGKPVFAGPTLSKDSPLLDEYKAIKKKYNFWSPQYSIPSFASIGIGVICITKGINEIIDLSDKYNNLDDKERRKRSTKAGVYMAIGFTIPIVTTAIICCDLLPKKRLSMYKAYNKKSMNKMRKKAAELYMQPNMNPFDNSIGMDFCEFLVFS